MILKTVHSKLSKYYYYITIYYTIFIKNKIKKTLKTNWLVVNKAYFILTSWMTQQWRYAIHNLACCVYKYLHVILIIYLSCHTRGRYCCSHYNFSSISHLTYTCFMERLVEHNMISHKIFVIRLYKVI